MADSRRLQILKNIQTTLRAMTVAGGYNYGITDATQVSLDPTFNLLSAVPAAMLPYYLVEPTPDGGKTYYPAEQMREVFRVTITGRMDAAGADPVAKATTWENMAADLEKALTADHTRGGYATDTRLGVPAPVAGVGSNVVILLQPVDIRIYRDYRDGV